MSEICSRELREKFQQFFETNGHQRIAGSSLIPDNDPSVLFTTAGMHPLVPYLQGQPHPQGKRLTDVQRCLRTTDIDEVGDASHATVFEMLGNWSLGDYGRQEAINLSWKFLTDRAWLGLEKEKIAVSVFAGDEKSPRDEQAARSWQKMGLPKERIGYLDNKENWWPAGGKEIGPQGPDTEMFYWTGKDKPPTVFNPKDKQWMEIWNDVFMEFNRTDTGELLPLKQKNIDTGMGLERTVMALNHFNSIYEIDCYRPLMNYLASDANFQPEGDNKRRLRIIADHIKAATFIMTDENKVSPGNTEQGYVLRRLMRRAAVVARALQVQDFKDLFSQGMEITVQQYETVYPQMRQNLAVATEEAAQEIRKFEGTLSRGLKKFEEIEKMSSGKISGDDLLLLLQSYGFPVEITVEMAKERGKEVDWEVFKQRYADHQEKSRAGAVKKFKGGLVDASKKATQYHTATHLLHAALHKILGEQVTQKGSNITAERLRFDFNYGQKLNTGQISQIEEAVNQAIARKMPVARYEMTVEEAKNMGALGLFVKKYGDMVSVYKINDWSVEICGGPHVENTGELGKFRIVKEESAAAGIRRIKAVLE